MKKIVVNLKSDSNKKEEQVVVKQRSQCRTTHKRQDC